MSEQKIYKKILSNGLTILVMPSTRIPKVSVQLWYNVGSKDEKSGQKGIAHLIEHMIFKGTAALSESDINLITNKLSGSCNAFTSHDYTGYLFDFPSQHWYEALPIMADCMRNCTFKEQFLNSELKAVIQELKMYNDDYGSALTEKMLEVMFTDHPYHYPVIGYKQDLWNLKRQALLDFYNEHYIPNNATLVVVGDVTPEDVFVRAEQNFGHLEARVDYKKQEFYHGPDIVAKSVTLQRDVQQAFGMVAWIVPGLCAKQDYLLDLMSWILGSGKGSRLYRKIVDEAELATDIECFVYDLFEQGIFFVSFQPAAGVDPERIIAIIQQEIADIVAYGVTAQEIERSVKKTEIDILSLRENNQNQAYLLGKYFTATGEHEYLDFYRRAIRAESLADDLRMLAEKFLRPAVMHRGLVVPVSEQEKVHWTLHQEESDRTDARVLSLITRQAEVEDGVQVNSIMVEQPPAFTFPRAQTFTLSNGVQVLYHHNPFIPKIDLILDFKAKHYFDPENKQGLNMFLFDMLQEGTRTHTSQQFSQEIERYGMTLKTFPGHISMSMLSEDIQTGLGFIADIVQEALFDELYIEKVRSRLLSDVIDFWDTPSQFIAQLARERIYHNHPYEKNLIGNQETISGITREDLLHAYKQWITPFGSRLAIVGDLSGVDLPRVLEQIFGTWQGPEIYEMDFPAIIPLTHNDELNKRINRDQVVLCFSGLSVTRKDADFDKILLFDQVFTGGVLGSMSSRLFALRERSGLFYTIGGSLLAGVGKQPGMLYIKTIVSPDRLAEAEESICAVIRKGAHDLTVEEHMQAQRALVNSLVDNFSHNGQTATTFLFLDTFGLKPDYFDHRAAHLLSITRESVQHACAQLLDNKPLLTVRVGRV